MEQLRCWHPMMWVGYAMGPKESRKTELDKTSGSKSAGFGEGLGALGCCLSVKRALNGPATCRASWLRSSPIRHQNARIKFADGLRVSAGPAQKEFPRSDRCGAAAWNCAPKLDKTRRIA